MRFLTFNLWHGLSPSTPLAMEALEPVTRRKLREDLQLQVLGEAQPDIAFFQEVNPVVERAPLIAEHLGMEAKWHPDLVGVKLFGLGLPFNLNSGLAILASRRLGVRSLQAVSLARPQQKMVSAWASWQLKEERFAFFCETLIPDWGRVLLVNTHLHHGFEATNDVLNRLEQMGEEFGLSGATLSELRERMLRGNERRKIEIGHLLGHLKSIESRYEAVFLAGDFNAEPESEICHILRDAGFKDAWQEAKGQEEGFTFDQRLNGANHLLQNRFPSTLVVEDLTFSPKTKEELNRMSRTQESRPRRIDYLWFRTRQLSLQVKEARLIGFPNAEGLAPSDHFGVLVDIE